MNETVICCTKAFQPGTGGRFGECNWTVSKRMFSWFRPNGAKESSRGPSPPGYRCLFRESEQPQDRKKDHNKSLPLRLCVFASLRLRVKNETSESILLAESSHRPRRSKSSQCRGWTVP